MPDREKVKEFLTHLSLNAYEYKQSDDTVCGYDYLEVERIADYALSLLKEQEAVEPTLICEGRNKYYNNYVCPRCDNDVIYEQNYCSECGMRFLWEGR